MNLVSSADRLYKDKTSEIEEKYFISKDKVYLYISGYDCELLVNDEYQTKIKDIHSVLKELLFDQDKYTDYGLYQILINLYIPFLQIFRIFPIPLAKKWFVRQL